MWNGKGVTSLLARDGAESLIMAVEILPKTVSSLPTEKTWRVPPMKSKLVFFCLWKTEENKMLGR